jgi:hypothetical protein
MKAIWKMNRGAKGHIYTIMNATPAEIAELVALKAAEKAAGEDKAAVVFDDEQRPLYFTMDELEIEIDIEFTSKRDKLYVVGSLVKDLKQAYENERSPKLEALRAKMFLDAEAEIKAEKALLTKQRLASSVTAPAGADLNP